MTSTHESPIRLSLSHQSTVDGLVFQQLEIELTNPKEPIRPIELRGLELPPGIDTSGGVVISGRAPVWLYGYLIHQLHPTRWVACYDPRCQGGVVVATHSRQVTVGQIIVPTKAREAEHLCPALLVVGPPDSGKSVLSHALLQSMLAEHLDVFLQRVNWDGEGNWVLEMQDRARAEAMKLANKGQLTPNFFTYHASAILALRREHALVIADAGGMVQPEKQPLLESCTHYLIISADPAEIPKWHEFCRDRGNLAPVAVIHSTLEPKVEIHGQQPYLELTCGPWQRGNACPIPAALRDCVRALVTPKPKRTAIAP